MDDASADSAVGLNLVRPDVGPTARAAFHARRRRVGLVVQLLAAHAVRTPHAACGDLACEAAHSAGLLGNKDGHDVLEAAGTHADPHQAGNVHHVRVHLALQAGHSHVVQVAHDQRAHKLLACGTPQLLVRVLERLAHGLVDRRVVRVQLDQHVLAQLLALLGRQARDGPRRRLPRKAAVPVRGLQCHAERVLVGLVPRARHVVVVRRHEELGELRLGHVARVAGVQQRLGHLDSGRGRHAAVLPARALHVGGRVRDEDGRAIRRVVAARQELTDGLQRQGARERLEDDCERGLVNLVPLATDRNSVALALHGTPQRLVLTQLHARVSGQQKPRARHEGRVLLKSQLLLVYEPHDRLELRLRLRLEPHHGVLTVLEAVLQRQVRLLHELRGAVQLVQRRAQLPHVGEEDPGGILLPHDHAPVRAARAAVRVERHRLHVATVILEAQRPVQPCHTLFPLQQGQRQTLIGLGVILGHLVVRGADIAHPVEHRQVRHDWVVLQAVLRVRDGFDADRNARAVKVVNVQALQHRGAPPGLPKRQLVGARRERARPRRAGHAGRHHRVNVRRPPAAGLAKVLRVHLRFDLCARQLLRRDELLHGGLGSHDSVGLGPLGHGRILEDALHRPLGGAPRALHVGVLHTQVEVRLVLRHARPVDALRLRVGELLRVAAVCAELRLTQHALRTALARLGFQATAKVPLAQLEVLQLPLLALLLLLHDLPFRVNDLLPGPVAGCAERPRDLREPRVAGLFPGGGRGGDEVVRRGLVGTGVGGAALAALQPGQFGFRRGEVRLEGGGSVVLHIVTGFRHHVAKVVTLGFRHEAHCAQCRTNARF